MSGTPSHLHGPRLLGSSDSRNACSLSVLRISVWLIGEELHKASLPKLWHQGELSCAKFEWTRHEQRGSGIFQWTIKFKKKKIASTEEVSNNVQMYTSVQNTTVRTK